MPNTSKRNLTRQLRPLAGSRRLAASRRGTTTTRNARASFGTQLLAARLSASRRAQIRTVGGPTTRARTQTSTRSTSRPSSSTPRPSTPTSRASSSPSRTRSTPRLVSNQDLARIYRSTS